MGRARTKKKVASKATDPPSQPAANAKGPSILALLEKAQDLIVQCDYELAEKFVRRVLEQQPSNAQATEMLGVVQLEQGEMDAAKQTFRSLVPPSAGAPSPPPPSAYLYLAQLSDDEPRVALAHYQAAVDILKTQLKGKERANQSSEEDEAEVKGNIVRALIGQVEIWMDPSYDLCFEPDAEKTCEDLITHALQIDPDNPEALQSLASVRMSQQRPDDARECLEKVWAVWKDLDPDDPKLPPIPVRLSLVKLFIELSLFNPALLVLHGVMSSDDQEVEAWYLEGWCFLLMSEKAQENGGRYEDLTWQELVQDSRDCLETCQVLHRNQEHPDAPILEHVKELIAKLKDLGVSPSPLQGESEGDWEDVEGGEDDDEDEDEDVEMQ
ncbi:TPR-like protein [Pluteus cervinus]|uniref:TPR-like protein n=1 Tax=Pluteus cervinus TaxID=181527 RepID=A0ACD3BBL7_9AGAR|nr:TPR-like protein [Pluteus cervinus]